MQTDFFKEIKKRKDPYIIAELGSNHNGDMDLARKLIDAAKYSGADCVKFQSWTKKSIFSKKKYDDNYNQHNNNTLRSTQKILNP